MAHWILQILNSLTFGALLFLLSAGFTLIFGLMRIPNLAHGALFMLGAYGGLSALQAGAPFWLAVVAGGALAAAVGVPVERWILRRLGSNENAQVLATIGIAFIIADAALAVWGGNPQAIPPPEMLRGAVEVGGVVFPRYRLAVVLIALAVAMLLWLAIDRTRIGAMLRAGVDDLQMARGIGIPVLRIYTLTFCLGAALAGMGGVLAGPILSVYPGLDHDMLPLALVVVILGGVGSLPGALAGSFLTGLLYTLGQDLLPELAYVILFVPMVIVLSLRPRGLFGRVAT